MNKLKNENTNETVESLINAALAKTKLIWTYRLNGKKCKSDTYPTEGDSVGCTICFPSITEGDNLENLDGELFASAPILNAYKDSENAISGLCKGVALHNRQTLPCRKGNVMAYTECNILEKCVYNRFIANLDPTSLIRMSVCNFLFVCGSLYNTRNEVVIANPSKITRAELNAVANTVEGFLYNLYTTCNDKDVNTDCIAPIAELITMPTAKGRYVKRCLKTYRDLLNTAGAESTIKYVSDLDKIQKVLDNLAAGTLVVEG